MNDCRCSILREENILERIKRKSYCQIILKVVIGFVSSFWKIRKGYCQLLLELLNSDIVLKLQKRFGFCKKNQNIILLAFCIYLIFHLGAGHLESGRYFQGPQDRARRGRLGPLNLLFSI